MKDGDFRGITAIYRAGRFERSFHQYDKSADEIADMAETARLHAAAMNDHVLAEQGANHKSLTFMAASDTR